MKEELQQKYDEIKNKAKPDEVIIEKVVKQIKDESEAENSLHISDQVDTEVSIEHEDTLKIDE